MAVADFLMILFLLALTPPRPSRIVAAVLVLPAAIAAPRLTDVLWSLVA